MDKQIFTLAVFSFLLLTGCQNKVRQHDDEQHSEERIKDHAEGSSIELDWNKAQAVGIKVEKATMANFQGVVKVSGKIMPAAGNEHTVVATSAGIVSLAQPITEGMKVGAGTTMFHISSSCLPEGDVAQRARIAYEEAKADYLRIKALVEDKIVTQKEYLQAKANVEKAALAYKAVGKSSSAKGVGITSAMSGYVKECLVKNGDYVEVGQPIMVVSQSKRLFLRAEVPERNYTVLGNIVSANFKTSYSDVLYRLAQMNGKLVSYGKTPYAGSSFIPVTFEFDNRGGIMPGAYADIYLLTNNNKRAISLPISAITEEQGIYFVYIQESKGHYRKQEVRLGNTNGARVEIVSGLNGGEMVVTQGAVHIKLAAASGSVPTHSHE